MQGVIRMNLKYFGIMLRNNQNTLDMVKMIETSAGELHLPSNKQLLKSLTVTTLIGFGRGRLPFKI